jgi:hypothetical protein
MRHDPDERFNLAHDQEHQTVVRERTARLLSRLMENRAVDLLPSDAEVHRSPIYLTPGHNEHGHEQALIRRFLGDRSVNEFPTSSET